MELIKLLKKVNFCFICAHIITREKFVYKNSAKFTVDVLKCMRTVVHIFVFYSKNLKIRDIVIVYR